MLNLEQRKNDLVVHIERQTKLLSEWERKFDLAENPTEVQRCKFEIEKIKQSVKYYNNQYLELFKDHAFPPLHDYIIKQLIIHQAINDITNNSISESEMISILNKIQTAFKESKIKLDDQVRSEVKSIENNWNSPNISTSGKLKLSVPIIPTILKYEAELGADVKESLKGFWGKCWKRLNKPIQIR